MGKLEDDLTELKRCYKKGLISKRDYEEARRKRLGLNPVDKSWWERLRGGAMSLGRTALVTLINSILGLGVFAGKLITF
ncbi:5500_t:CDS:2 [Racocetra persica]|uniref:5500_t:CDS:1 n=1 Tax=Racocetra persica TaxID=160502 RepID=A0ACA9LIA4_9GLOM|nr:5500_t:CDS:2 [Racocetra persica]